MRYFKNRSGFSLLEIVITIIVIAVSLSAIVESFVIGSVTSVSISNQQVAQNIAKQTMAEFYYCRNGGTSAICAAFGPSPPPSSLPWSNPSSLNTTQSISSNNECFYTTVTANCADVTDTNGDISVSGCPPPPLPASYISAVINTGWFALSGGTCPLPPAAYPSVTVSTIFANY